MFFMYEIFFNNNKSWLSAKEEKNFKTKTARNWEEKTFQINMSEDSSLFTHNLSDGGGWKDKSILVDKDCRINFKLDPFFLFSFSSSFLFSLGSR